VSADDDRIVELSVVLKPPSYGVLRSLFPGHEINFDFEEDEEEQYTFNLFAGRRLMRVDALTSATPNNLTPLWYGFEFEFAPEQAPIAAANVDFSGLLYHNYGPTIEQPIKRRKTSEDETDRGVATFKEQQVPTPEPGLEEL
jgi:hypothetical protein